ncbi:MAG: hypothetical protein M1823_002262 [Watsoniomyces obsoletus]|nr:MAG: hypothetical protein M1823_002262 [Watsoniomyces obsoletus]
MDGRDAPEPGAGSWHAHPWFVSQTTVVPAPPPPPPPSTSHEPALGRDPWEDTLNGSSTLPPPYAPPEPSEYAFDDGKDKKTGGPIQPAPPVSMPRSFPTTTFSIEPFDSPSSTLSASNRVPELSGSGGGRTPTGPASSARPPRPFSFVSDDPNRSSRLLSSIPEHAFVRNPAYEIPPPPVPPTPQPWSSSNAHGTPSSGPSPTQHSRTSSILGRASQRLSTRFQSTRGSRRISRISSVSSPDQYGLLEEREESDISTGRPNPTPYRGGGPGYDSAQYGDEDDAFELVGFDLSTFEAPIGLQRYPTTRPSPAVARVIEEQMQSTLAAEYDQLEAQGQLTGGLGSGMVGATLHINPNMNATMLGSSQSIPYKPTTPGLSRGESIRDVGRREARERGEMVVINEVVPGVDIGFIGADEDVVDPTLERTQTGARFGSTGGQKQTNPEMPNWKPVSMRWPYLIFLILLSLSMAAVQEFLFQLSVYRRKHNEGIIQFIKPKELSMAIFFCWKYLPTIIAVSYGVLWQIIDYEVKRLEPYYQLSRHEGALAAESLNRNYLTGYAILAPFTALRYRQWAVMYSSVIYLIAGPLVPVLQNASMIITPKQEQRKANQLKFLEFHPVWSRLLTACLLINAILGCLLLRQLRRKSGLLSDPKGIAGIAAMANKSHILMDFRDLDTATEAAIHNRLKHRRYNLHKSTLWQGEYLSVGDSSVEEKTARSPQPIMLRLVAGIPYIAFMLAFMGFIPLVMFQKKVNVLVKEVPFLLTAIASVVRVIWTTLDSDVRMMEPFYILSRRNAPSSVLTLDYRGTIPGWLPIKAFLSGHYLVSLVGLGAVMAEVLTVCVSSLGVRGDIFFPGAMTNNNSNNTNPGGGSPAPGQDDDRSNSEETFKSVWVSFTLVMGILTWLCLSAILVYHRRRHKFLPREPGTIASVLAFIHQSKMLWDFVDTEKMNSRQMTVHLKKLGKRYGLGWSKGRDGNDHCGVDEEPLTTNYKFNSSFKDAVKPWSNTWDRY